MLSKDLMGERQGFFLKERKKIIKKMSFTYYGYGPTLARIRSDIIQISKSLLLPVFQIK